jgi:hypothetical protein
MSAHIGFRLSSGVVGDGRPIDLIDWTHAPAGRGYAAKPVAEDSHITTVMIEPRFVVAFNANSFVEDAFANLEWNAAGEARLTAEIDLARGTRFSLIATSIKVSVGWVLGSTQGVANPLTGARMIPDATLGRGSSGRGEAIRTRRPGVIEPAGVSAVLTIPPFAHSLTVATRSAPPAFTARVTQLSNGVPVQVDDIVGPSFSARALVNRSADSFTVTNLGALAMDALVPFYLSFL